MIFGPYIHEKYQSCRPILGGTGSYNVAYREMNIGCWMDAYGQYHFTREYAMKTLDEKLKVFGHIIIDDQEKFDKLKTLA